MFSVLRNPRYARLYLAQVVALVGTGVATVALALTTHELAGPEAGRVLGTALTIKMVAYVCIAPTANAQLAGRPAKAVLVGADLTRCAAALCLPFITQIWQVYALVLLLQAASATFTPTFQAIIPELFDNEDDYTAALSLSRIAYDVEGIASPTLAAVALSVVAPRELFYATALGFIGSAALILRTALPGPKAATGPFARRLTKGIRILTTPPLRPILALNLAVAAAGAFVLVNTVLIAREHLGLDASGTAWLLASTGVGSILASSLLPRLLSSHGERAVLCGAAVALPAAIAAVPTILTLPQPVAALALACAIVGFAWAAALTPVGRIIRRVCRDDDLASAFAAQFSLSHAAWLITYPLAGALGASSVPLAAYSLALLALVGAVGIRWLWPRTNETMDPCQRPCLQPKT